VPYTFLTLSLNCVFCIRTIGGKASKIPGVASNRYLNAAYNWMPPEIMKGELSTEKSDIYGFCTVMWEMFTGW